MSHVCCVRVGLVYIGRWDGSVCCFHTRLLKFLTHHLTSFPHETFSDCLISFPLGVIFPLTICSPPFPVSTFLNAFVSYFKSRFEHIYAAAFLTTDLIASGVLLRDRRHPSSAFVRSRHPLPRFYSENRSGSLLFSCSWLRSI